MKKFFIILFFVSSFIFSQSLIINEEFNGGTTPPSGWLFFGITGTYTSSGSYGKNPPSIRFDNTGDSVITPFFNSKPDTLRFWIKGQSTDANSNFSVFEFINNQWILLTNIKPLPTTGTIFKFKLNSSTKRLKFVYIKSAGNLAFDDVIVSESNEPFIYLSTSSLSFENTPIDSISQAKSYKLYAKNLQGDLQILSSSNQYLISLSQNSNFTNSLTLVKNSSGIIDTTIIFVKFKPASQGNIQAELIHFSTNSDTVRLNLMGTGILIKPEPNAYPENFVAYALSDSSVKVEWNEANDNNTDGYLILMGQSLQDISSPIDGIEYSENNFTKKILKGNNQTIFYNLLASTIYYFKIFPYSNSGSYINYKTDGQPPYDSAKTKLKFVFQNIIPKRTDVSGFNDWIDNDITGTTYLQLLKNTSYTITPKMYFYDYAYKKLKFKARTYGTYDSLRHIIRVSISTNNGKSWIVLGQRSPKDNTLREMDEFDLSAYNSIYARIKIETPNAGSNRGAGIDDIEIIGVLGEKRTYPGSHPMSLNQNADESSDTTVKINWSYNQDNEGYLIKIVDNLNSLTVPTNGTIINDSIGFAYNVDAKESSCRIEGLSSNKIYYAAVFPFANSGSNRIYNTVNYSVIAVKTLAPKPKANAINFKADSITNGFISLSWDNDDQAMELPQGYLLIAMVDSSKISLVKNLAEFQNDIDLSDGFASKYFLISDDLKISFNNLNSEKKYHFFLISYNGPNYNYKLDQSTPYISAIPSIVSYPKESFEEKITDYILYQNYPNPFNSTTNIKVVLPERSFVEIKVYNMLGSEVMTIFSGYLDKGYKEFKVNLENLSGGVYIYQMKTLKKTLSLKMIYLK